MRPAADCVVASVSELSVASDGVGESVLNEEGAPEPSELLLSLTAVVDSVLWTVVRSDQSTWTRTYEL